MAYSKSQLISFLYIILPIPFGWVFYYALYFKGWFAITYLFSSPNYFVKFSGDFTNYDNIIASEGMITLEFTILTMIEIIAQIIEHLTTSSTTSLFKKINCAIKGCTTSIFIFTISINFYYLLYWCGYYSLQFCYKTCSEELIIKTDFITHLKITLFYGIFSLILWTALLTFILTLIFGIYMNIKNTVNYYRLKPEVITDNSDHFNNLEDNAAEDTHNIIM